MLKLKTHFEQVSLEIVKKIAKQEVQQEKAREQARDTKTGKVARGLWRAQPRSIGTWKS